MRLVLALALVLPLLGGCELAHRFDSVEGRINRAVPPDSGVQAARQRLIAHLAELPQAQEAIERQWSARLRLRALSCGGGELPTWRDSDADIRKRMSGSACLPAQDRALERWIGLQRVRLMLAQGPLRPVPPSVPPVISHREFIGPTHVARSAPVAIVRGPTGFDVLDLGSGKSLYTEASPSAGLSQLDLSPNARLFVQASSGRVVIRAVEGGETLVQLQPANGLLWLDAQAVALRPASGSELRLLDLESGEDTPVPGNRPGDAYLAHPAPNAENRYNLLSGRGVTQIELTKVGGRIEAQLVNERLTSSGRGFAINTGGPSSDGRAWVDGHQGLRIVDMETLAIEEREFSPVGTQTAWPTADPHAFIVSFHLPAGDTFGSRFIHQLYDFKAQTLAPLNAQALASTRYLYIPPLKRLAVIDNQTIRFLDALAAEPARPANAVLAVFIDEMNQRRLASSVQQLGGPPGGWSAPPAAPGAGAAAASRADYAPMVSLPSHAQVEAVGVYQGSGARGGYQGPRTAGAVEIRVRRSPRPVALVLSAYEPVRWSIVREPGAQLAAVFLSGYHESTVLGAGDARVLSIGSHYAYNRESAQFLALQQSVARVTGKPIQVFQGRYEASSFSVGGQP